MGKEDNIPSASTLTQIHAETVEFARVHSPTGNEITVESALDELREMFPGDCPHIEFCDYRPIGGSLVVLIQAGGLGLGDAATLIEAVAQVRKWKESHDVKESL